jgi:hypothetical protein
MKKKSMLLRLFGGSGASATQSFRLINILYYSLYDSSTTLPAGYNDWSTRYNEMRAVQQKDQQGRWHNFVRTVQALWGVGLALLLWSLFEGDLYSCFASVAMLLFVWFSMGYRIWVLRTKTYPPIIDYLKLALTAPFAGLPLNAMDLLE